MSIKKIIIVILGLLIGNVYYLAHGYPDINDFATGTIDYLITSGDQILRLTGIGIVETSNTMQENQESYFTSQNLYDIYGFIGVTNIVILFIVFILRLTGNKARRM